MGGNMRFFRKRSKRTSTKQRVKQEKKIREHNKKMRKEKRLHPEKYRKSHKDPGVPNDCPFKEQVLKEAWEAKERKEREKEERRERFKRQREERNLARKEGREVEKPKHAELLDFVFPEEEPAAGSDEENKTPFCPVDKLVGDSDLVVHVLDARDPQSTLIGKVPKLCGEQGKRIVYVLNKADLVPKEVTKAWIKTLRFSHPAVAFKASKGPGSKCIGLPSLLSTLKSLNERNERLRVGLVGYPGVGKRSVARSIQGKLTRKFDLAELCGLALDQRKGSVYGKEEIAELPDPVLVFSRNVFPRLPRPAWLLRYNKASPPEDADQAALDAWAEKELGAAAVQGEYLRDFREGGLKYFVRAPEGTKVKPTDEFGTEFKELPDVLEAEAMELNRLNPITIKTPKKNSSSNKRAREEDDSEVEGEEEEEEASEQEEDEDEEEESSEEEEAPKKAAPKNGRGKKRKPGASPAGRGKKKRRRT